MATRCLSTLPTATSKSFEIATAVTDPAGHWKQYARDALGNLRTVLEPDPTANPVPGPPNPPPAYPVSSAPTGTLLTVYTYDLLNHLIQVSMPRTVSDRNSGALDSAAPATGPAQRRFGSQALDRTG